jgi:DNA repair protein RadC
MLPLKPEAGPYWVRLELVREPGRPAVKVENADDLGPVLLSYFQGRDREEFVVVCLDARHRDTALHSCSVGSVSASIVHPREVFKVAILTNASAVILAHNHPSGDPEPSPEDIAITRRLAKAGGMMGIPVLDHLVAGEDRVVSLTSGQGLPRGEFEA